MKKYLIFFLVYTAVGVPLFYLTLDPRSWGRAIFIAFVSGSASSLGMYFFEKKELKKKNS